MKEQFKGICESDVEACIPDDVLVQIETEAGRLADVLADIISYSDDIRMENGDGSRRSLQTIESDAEALALFRHQLETDPVSGFRGSSKSRACRKGTGERSGADHGGMPVTGGYTTVGGAIGSGRVSPGGTNVPDSRSTTCLA